MRYILKITHDSILQKVILNKTKTVDIDSVASTIKKPVKREVPKWVLSMILRIFVEYTTTDSREGQKGGKGLTKTDIVHLLNNFDFPPFSKELHERQVFEKKELRQYHINKKRKKGYSQKNVERGLKYLSAIGEVVKHRGEYYLSETTVFGIKKYSKSFGTDTIESLIKLNKYHYNTLDENIKGLVEIFGCHIFYCLLEIARPSEYFKTSAVKADSKMTKFEFSELWLENVMQLNVLYKYFLETFLNKPEDSFIKEFRKLHFSHRDSGGLLVYKDTENNEYRTNQIGIDPITGEVADLYLNKNNERYIPNTIPAIKVPYKITPLSYYNTDFRESKSDGEIHYELNEQTYDQISKIFNNLYPTHYGLLIKAAGVKPKYGLENKSLKKYID